METLLPPLLALLAGALLLLALAAFWQSFRAAFLAVPIDPAYGGVGLGTRATLLDEKHAVLRALKDLEEERESGKISEDEFRKLDAEYRGRARSVLQALDADVVGFRDEADKLLSDYVKKHANITETREERLARERTARATRSCPSCQAANDLDAIFCKKCATKLEGVA